MKRFGVIRHAVATLQPQPFRFEIHLQGTTHHMDQLDVRPKSLFELDVPRARLEGGPDQLHLSLRARCQEPVLNPIHAEAGPRSITASLHERRRCIEERARADVDDLAEAHQGSHRDRAAASLKLRQEAFREAGTLRDFRETQLACFPGFAKACAQSAGGVDLVGRRCDGPNRNRRVELRL